MWSGRLLGLVGHRSEAGGCGGARVEVSSERGLQEGSENDVGAPEGGESQPEEEDELEGEVEWEPIHHAEQALKDAVKIVSM